MTMINSDDPVLCTREISLCALSLAQIAAIEFNENSESCLTQFKYLLENAAFNQDLKYDPTAPIQIGTEDTSLYAAVHSLAKKNPAVGIFEKEIERIFEKETTLASAEPQGTPLDYISEESLQELDGVKDTQMYKSSEEITSQEIVEPKAKKTRKTKSKTNTDIAAYNRTAQNHFKYR